MRLRVTYHRVADLLADGATQFVHGGVLVRIEPPPGLELFAAVELEVVAPFGTSILLQGEVVQLLPSVGVAVAFAPQAIADLLEAARQAPDAPGPAPTHEQVASVPNRPAPNETATKIHAALYGNRDERMRAVRENNKSLHGYVLRNPGIGLDEILAIAKMNTVAPDLLAAIGARREWAERPDIAIALVRNPKTPTPTAVRLLDHVSAQDLRQLAKDAHTRPAVQQAARKKVIVP